MSILRFTQKMKTTIFFGFNKEATNTLSVQESEDNLLNLDFHRPTTKTDEVLFPIIKKLAMHNERTQLKSKERLEFILAQPSEIHGSH